MANSAENQYLPISISIRKPMRAISFFLPFLLLIQCNTKDDLKKHFISPPSSSSPGVYWYFMDGNLSREGMSKDLESMKEAGISHLMYINVWCVNKL
jgi:hypothetical protein